MSRAFGTLGMGAGGSGGGSFLPEDYIAAKSEARANIITLSLFAIVLGAVIAAFMVTHQRWQSIKARQISVNAQYKSETDKIEQLKQLESQRAAILEKAEITASLVEQVPRWAMLGELALRMPERMRLDELKLKSQRIEVKPVTPAKPPPLVKSLLQKESDAKKQPEVPKATAPKFEYTLTISGSAEENNDIADYLASLKTSPILRRVELGFIRESKEGDRLLRKFEITANLKSAVESGELASSLRGLVSSRVAKDEGKAPKKGKGMRFTLPRLSWPLAGAKEGQ